MGLAILGSSPLDPLQHIKVLPFWRRPWWCVSIAEGGRGVSGSPIRLWSPAGEHAPLLVLPSILGGRCTWSSVSLCSQRCLTLRSWRNQKQPGKGGVLIDN